MEPTPTTLLTAPSQSAPQEAPALKLTSDGGQKLNVIPAVYIVAIVAAVGWAIIILIVIVKCTGCCRKRKPDTERGEGDGRDSSDHAEKAQQARRGAVADIGTNNAGPSNAPNDGEFEEISLSAGVGTAHAVPLWNVKKTAPSKPGQDKLDDPSDPDFYNVRTVEMNPRSKPARPTSPVATAMLGAVTTSV
ncbi:hypothetical protein F5B17DRAFT_415866 [Nemania serpens]|nr:hypothetical protein F5B17DRAFT_415866 [Nemania serpens]